MTTVTVSLDDLIALLSATSKLSDPDNRKKLNTQESDAFSTVWDNVIAQTGCRPEYLHGLIEDTGNQTIAIT